MIITYRTIHSLMKALFSLVILQLFFIVRGAEAGDYTHIEVLRMLEYSAAGAMCILGGWVLLEYVKNSEEKT